MTWRAALERYEAELRAQGLENEKVERRIAWLRQFKLYASRQGLSYPNETTFSVLAGYSDMLAKVATLKVKTVGEFLQFMVNEKLL